MYIDLIDSAGLASLIATGHCKIFDCRFSLTDIRWGGQAYLQGHIPGAHYLHLDHDLSSPITPQSGRHPLPDPAQLANKLAAAGVSQTDQVVVYDDAGGAIAGRAWWLLRWLGHEAVAVLDGGLPAWVRQGGNLQQGTPDSTPGNFTAKPRSNFFLETPQVAGGQGFQLMDARAAERFQGEVEPLDTVAGHIPGAINRPLNDNLQADGCFKAADVLRAEWLDVLAGRQPEEIAHMCGSGVTACHNLLAMERAGLHGSRLYPGSWSEWIRDPKRPVGRV